MSAAPKTAFEKRSRTTLDVIGITPESIAKLKSPIGQRPLSKENDRVRQAMEKILADRGVIPGIITLGLLNGVCYVIDGQHRLWAFLASGLKEGVADVRYLHCATMQEIHREFVELNSRIVNMRPDDFLRALEDSITNIALIREKCPFVGYDKIRKNSNHAPVVSMAKVIQGWRGSARSTPTASSGLCAPDLAYTLSEEETELLISFLLLAFRAWSRDVENARLWNPLNLGLCMWVYRNMVIGLFDQKTTQLDRELFVKCLQSLSTNSRYMEFLVNRGMTERDRPYAYLKIQKIFHSCIVTNLHARGDKISKVSVPLPAWAHI